MAPGESSVCAAVAVWPESRRIPGVASRLPGRVARTTRASRRRRLRRRNRRGRRNRDAWWFAGAGETAQQPIAGRDGGLGGVDAGAAGEGGGLGAFVLGDQG